MDDILGKESWLDIAEDLSAMVSLQRLVWPPTAAWVKYKLGHVPESQLIFSACILAFLSPLPKWRRKPEALANVFGVSQICIQRLPGVPPWIFHPHDVSIWHVRILLTASSNLQSDRLVFRYPREGSEGGGGVYLGIYVPPTFRVNNIRTLFSRLTFKFTSVRASERAPKKFPERKVVRVMGLV